MLAVCSLVARKQTVSPVQGLAMLGLGCKHRDKAGSASPCVRLPSTLLGKRHCPLFAGSCH